MEHEARVRYGVNALLRVWGIFLGGGLLLYLYHKGYFQNAWYGWILALHAAIPSMLLGVLIPMSLGEIAIDRVGIRLRPRLLRRWNIAQIDWSDRPSYSINEDKWEQICLKIHTPDEHIKIYSSMSGYDEAIDFLLKQGIIPEHEAVHL